MAAEAHARTRSQIAKRAQSPWFLEGALGLVCRWAANQFDRTKKRGYLIGFLDDAGDVASVDPVFTAPLHT